MGIRGTPLLPGFTTAGASPLRRKTELPGWDGKVAGMPQPSQVVVWMVEGFVDNPPDQTKGTSTRPASRRPCSPIFC